MHRLFLKNSLFQTRSTVFELFVRSIGNLDCTYSKCMIWEDFTYDFLKTKYDTVIHRNKIHSDCFHLPKKDIGIDLVAIRNGKYSAVQAKFRKKYRNITWREFCTFDTLCNRSGPWSEKIVVTTSKAVNLYGMKCEKDRFYGYDFFNNMEKEEWMYILNKSEN